ncbi:MAG: hypothetical protein U0836_14560 [Pirellulales bacterium]
MTKPKFSLSSLLWATALVAVLAAWRRDHRQSAIAAADRQQQIDSLEFQRKWWGAEINRLRARNERQDALLRRYWPDYPVAGEPRWFVPDEADFAFTDIVPEP